MSGTGLDLDELLAGPIPDPELRSVATGIFAYAKVLLEEEDNLTRVGNLNGVAKDKLRARALELLGVAGSEESDAGALSEELEAVLGELAEAGESSDASDEGSGEGSP